MSNTKPPILPGPLQVLGRDGDDVCIGTTSAYSRRYPDTMSFRVRPDGDGGYSILTINGALDITVELSEDDPQLAVDLIEVTRLVLDAGGAKVLALRLLPDTEPSDV